MRSRDNHQHTKFMRTALRLAKRGVGCVEPNPAVGCVIVSNNRVIGKGCHKKFGGPHAELNALENCRESGADPQGATMYVTLEPCCHYGKTAPCTDAIIKAGLSTVIIAMPDPSPQVNGKGIRQLEDSGIEVETGVCESEAKVLNAPFIKFATTGKCWTIVKWAQSIDGKMAWIGGLPENRWISNEKSRKDAHKLRRRAQAVLVGVNTVIADDPLLTPRPAKGRKPIRIVLDTQLRFPLESRLLATANKVPLLIVTSKSSIDTKAEIAELINQRGAELLAVPTMKNVCDLRFLLEELSSRGIAQLLVEGGPGVITSFLKSHLADEFVVYIAPRILGRYGAAGITKSMSQLTESLKISGIEVRSFDGDVCISGFSQKAVQQLHL